VCLLLLAGLLAAPGAQESTARRKGYAVAVEIGEAHDPFVVASKRNSRYGSVSPSPSCWSGPRQVRPTHSVNSQAVLKPCSLRTAPTTRTVYRDRGGSPHGKVRRE